MNCYMDDHAYVSGDVREFGGNIKALQGQDPDANTVRVHGVPLKHYLGTDGTLKIGTEDDNNAVLSSDYLYIIGTD